MMLLLREIRRLRRRSMGKPPRETHHIDIEHPFRVIKRVFAPGRCDWLNARQCHGTLHKTTSLAQRLGHCRGGLTGWFYSRVDDDQRYCAAQAQGVSSARRLLGQLLTSLVSTSVR
jgi:hypothetical protein